MENELLLRLIQNAQTAGPGGGTRLIDIALGLIPNPRLGGADYRDDAERRKKPAAWITLEEGQHVPLDKKGIAIGGAGGWAMGKDFSHAMTREKREKWEKRGWKPENSKERIEADREKSRKAAERARKSLINKKDDYENWTMKLASAVNRRKLEEDYYAAVKDGPDGGDKRRIEHNLEILREVERNAKEEFDRAKAEYDKANEKFWKEQIRRNVAAKQLFKSAEDCKSVDDVQDYFRATEFFGKKGGSVDTRDEAVILDSDYIDAATAIATAKNVDKFMKEYPFMHDQLEGMECSADTRNAPNVFAFVNHGKTKFKMNPVYYRDNSKIESEFKKCVTEKFHPEGTTYAGIPLHEYTHAMENVVNGKLHGRRAADIIMERVAERINGRPYKENDEIAIWKGVSKYCWDNKGVKLINGSNGEPIGYQENDSYGRNTEWLAESMQEALESERPREVARMVKEEFDKLIKEVGL